MTEEIEPIPPNAFFIVDGVKFYPLVKAVINIGRSLEFEILDDMARIRQDDRSMII